MQRTDNPFARSVKLISKSLVRINSFTFQLSTVEVQYSPKRFIPPTSPSRERRQPDIGRNMQGTVDE